ncbi:MAG: DsrE family protein [Spirosomaceae bacterium]|jgi:hypothetical protein|nr:DsrE family protein [Spirosomataceae bacterium]
MNIKISTVLLLSSSLWMSAMAQTNAPKSEKTHKMVFQLATPDTAAYRALTRQLNNVLAYWPTAQIEVVVHNKGIGFMRKDQRIFEPEIAALKAKGIVFAVCENTMKQQKLTKEQILPQAIYVPVGIAEIVVRQEEGWAYLKAGF